MHLYSIGPNLILLSCYILTVQVTKNEEIKNIIDILGLKFDVKYDETNIKTLRYGHLMIMADQVSMSFLVITLYPKSRLLTLQQLRQTIDSVRIMMGVISKD